MQIARAMVQTAQLDEAINAIRPLLSPEVLSLNYSLGEDWSGDPAIFFKIVLTDEASEQPRMLTLTREISTLVHQHLEPLELWGIMPYFNYRNASEDAARQGKGWA